ncbi:helix-turn-helix domain-containing protein [Paracoccaceae bacterium Fryx2]|nr:helix-turn-helix domain-containing protein [Paracoccaceae bacterium Fryx2]
MGIDTFQSIRSLRQAGSALRGRRKARGLTQRDLAYRAGMPQSSVSDIETGVVSAGIDTYLRLLEAMGAELRIHDRETGDGVF